MESTDRDLTIGRAIRRLRASSGLSQKELARRVSVDPTYISHLEADRREPSLALLKSIARMLDVPSGLLLAVVLWADMPKEEKDRYSGLIDTLIDTAEAAQSILRDRRARSDDGE